MKSLGDILGGFWSRKQTPAVAPVPKPTVLVIDDDNDLLTIVAISIRAAGFHVLSTTSPAKGLDMLRFTRNNVGVIVLDYGMPRLNGAETLAHLRRLSPRTKVIGLTGVTAAELPETYARGVDHLLTKPCTNLHLVQTIHRLLGLLPAGHA